MGHRIAFLNFWGGFIPSESPIAQYIASALEEQGKKVEFVDKSEMPTIVVCSVFGPLIAMRPFYEQKHITKIFYTGENIMLPHYRQQYSADMLEHIFDIQIGFGRNPESIRIPLSVFYCNLYDSESWQSLTMKANVISTGIDSRMKRGCLIARHDHFGSRTPLVAQVQALGLALDFPSAFMKNVPGIEEQGLTKHQFLQKYLFNLCPENSQAPGYVTEKLLEAALAGCIPLYWGDAELEPLYNRNRVIYLDEQGFKKLQYLLMHENVLRAFFEQPVFVPNACDHVSAMLREGKQRIATNINKKQEAHI